MANFTTKHYKQLAKTLADSKAICKLESDQFWQMVGVFQFHLRDDNERFNDDTFANAIRQHLDEND